MRVLTASAAKVVGCNLRCCIHLHRLKDTFTTMPAKPTQPPWRHQLPHTQRCHARNPTAPLRECIGYALTSNRKGIIQELKQLLKLILQLQQTIHSFGPRQATLMHFWRTMCAHGSIQGSKKCTGCWLYCCCTMQYMLSASSAHQPNVCQSNNKHRKTETLRRPAAGLTLCRGTSKTSWVQTLQRPFPTKNLRLAALTAASTPYNNCITRPVRPLCSGTTRSTYSWAHHASTTTLHPPRIKG